MSGNYVGNAGALWPVTEKAQEQAAITLLVDVTGFDPQDAQDQIVQAARESGWNVMDAVTEEVAP